MPCVCCPHPPPLPVSGGRQGLVLRNPVLLMRPSSSPAWAPPPLGPSRPGPAPPPLSGAPLPAGREFWMLPEFFPAWHCFRAGGGAARTLPPFPRAGRPLADLMDPPGAVARGCPWHCLVPKLAQKWYCFLGTWFGCHGGAAREYHPPPLRSCSTLGAAVSAGLFEPPGGPLWRATSACRGPGAAASGRKGGGGGGYSTPPPACPFPLQPHRLLSACIVISPFASCQASPMRLFPPHSRTSPPALHSHWAETRT